MAVQCEKLFEQLDYTLVRGTLDKQIEDIVYDSRKAKKDTLFVCMTGTNSDGHGYIPDVIERGVAVVVVEKDVEVESDVTVIRVADTRVALAYISAAFFDYPARRMKTVGITGTKGKSTVAHMIRTMLDQAGKKCGIIGTIGAFIGNTELETINTTPESYELHKLFHMMADQGCEYMIMEASSQGMKLHRTDGILFDIGVFTNLSPDHIGGAEHADFDEYLNCKAKLFTQCKIAIGNMDNEHFAEIFKAAACKIETFGSEEESDYHISDIQHVTNGGDLSMSFVLKQKKHNSTDKVIVGLPGRFNVYNAVCAAAVCLKFGISFDTISHSLEHVKVRGRIEPVKVSDEFSVLVDYAHNELSCRSVLTTLREYNPARLVSIFGCGGNRSRDRRYTMGEAIGELSDFSIITADNSRRENVLDIMEDIKVGMKKSGGEYVAIPDRQEAVDYALQNARKGDMIILLGKGHEDYQEVDGVKYHFSDREAVVKAAEKISKKY